MSPPPPPTTTTEISLIDARSTSLTVTWPEVDGANGYILEYRKVIDVDKDSSSANDNDNDDNINNFTLLSDKLTQTQARKRNLEPETSYYFRVTGIMQCDTDISAGVGTKNWISHKDPIATISIKKDETSMDAPKVTHAGSNQALLVSWSWSSASSSSSSSSSSGGGKGSSGNDDNIQKYELQMRENTGGAEWTTIASSLSGTQVKKKNLTSSKGYSFRVRPTTTTTTTNDDTVPFSPPSDAVVARGLSSGIRQWFNSLENGTLIRSRLGGGSQQQQQQQPVPLADALGGKEFILLYASAAWCPPCRKFTPMLANFYNTVGRNRGGVEIVFLSCDHDPTSFHNYFHSHHPWMAIDYDDDGREKILANINVSGIPRLVVLSGKTGRIIESNAVGQSLDLQRWRALDK